MMANLSTRLRAWFLAVTDAVRCSVGRCRPELIETELAYNSEIEVCQRCRRVHRLIWAQL